MPHDLSLDSGERQTAASYEAIRADHRFRYEWADARLPEGDAFGVDCFCGNGYGAGFLSRKRIVLGIDGSLAAIRSAAAHYATPRTIFRCAYWPFNLPSRLDFAVSLESIEHVADGEGMFAALVCALKPGAPLIYSTPNEERLPHAGMGNHFHHRHYTLAQTLELARANGLDVIEWAGQDVYTMDGQTPTGLLGEASMQLRPDTPAQFTIVHAKRR